jgi:hypothetical protein
VNLIHSSGKDGDFYPIDYRIYSPETDGKTKNEHFQEMFLRAIADKNLKARTILFDSWYADEKMIQMGIKVKLKEIPFFVKLFKIVSTDGHIDWVITNSPDYNLWADDVKENNAVRWQVEEFHRAYKQLTGSEKCQCRAARSQNLSKTELQH